MPLTLRAQDPAAQCPDGSTRLSGGWCVGDLFAGIGGPVTYDGNGMPIPAWDAAGRPVQRLDADGNPIPQRAGEDGWLNAASSSRFIRNPLTGQPVCQFANLTQEDATGTEETGYSCRNEPYWGFIFEPVCIDAVTGLDVPGGRWDANSSAVCLQPPDVANPTAPQFTVLIPQARNAGTFLLGDADANFPPGGAGPLQTVVNPAGGFTYSCAVDPASGHLWTTDFFTNKIHEFAATGTPPLQTINLSNTTLGPKCGQDFSGLIGGCGAVGPIVFASEDGTTTDFFVGTTMGTIVDGSNVQTDRVSKILRYHNTGVSWIRAEEYIVPVSESDGVITDFSMPPPGGVTGMDLAADRETMFYTAGDSYVRVFNIHGRPLADDATTDLGARLIQNGLQLIDVNGQEIAPSDPAAASARFGLIPITNRGDDTLRGWPAFQLRMLPPGDPLKFDNVTHEQIRTGMMIAVGGSVPGAEVNLHDFIPADPANGRPVLTAQNRVGYVHDLRDNEEFLPNLNHIVGFDLTPDGRSFWTGGAVDGTSTAQLVKFQISDRALEAGPITLPGNAAAMNAICIAKGYSAGATQPDCSATPLSDPYNLCHSGPPTIAAASDRTNYEGDSFTDLPIVSAPGTLSYSAVGLPPGVQINQSTGLVSSDPIVDPNGSGVYHVTITTTNADGSSHAHFDWTIVNWSLPPQLSVQSGEFSLSPPHGGSISIDLSAQDPDACESVAFQLAPGSDPLPPGLSMELGVPPPDTDQKCIHRVSNGPYTATITGTPASVAGGTPTADGGASFTFTVLAIDTHESDTALDADGVRVRVRGVADSQRQTFTINVANNAPVVEVVAPAQVEATGPAGALVDLDASGSHDPDPGDALTFAWKRDGNFVGADPTLSLTLPIGLHTLRVDVTDNFGRTSSRDVLVRVEDTTPPTIANMPASQTLEATAPGGAVATFSLPTASDLVDAAPTVSCTPAPGATFPVDVTTVTCTAADHAFPLPNSATLSFTITVTDLTKPTIDSHASLVVEATGPAGAPVSYTPPATHDLIDGDGTATCAPAPGVTFPFSETTVTCSATDPHGNHAIDTTFTVTVQDTIKPVLDGVPASPPPIEATGPGGAVFNFGPVTATDSGSGVQSVSCDRASGLFPLDSTPVACTALDQQGNTSTQTFIVTVRDTTPPALPPLPDVVAFASSNDGAIVTFVTAFSDSVDGSIALTCSPASGSTFPVGITTVNCWATDAHSNTATAGFTVTVKNQPPVCSAAQPSVSELWPPNHTFVSVSILGVIDPNMRPFTLAINRVLQDEPTNRLGDGDTPIDAVINGSTVQLRAERSAKGDGRVYLIDFTATNIDGGSCSGTVRVVVPHDRGKNGSAVDSLVRYNSLLAGGPPLSGPEFNLPPALTYPGSQTSTAGKAVRLALKATDLNLDPLTYSASNLPAGLTLNAGTGVISGTPTTASAPTVTVSVGDGIAPPVSASFKWTIVAGKDKDKDRDKDEDRGKDKDKDKTPKK